MRPRTFGLMAAMIAVVLVPAAAISASKKPAEIPAAARKQGMAEAPAVVQALGVSCQVTDARFVGKSKDPKTKADSTFYEVDCASGPGYILQTAKDQPTTSFSCIEANTPTSPGKEPSLPCILPGNMNPGADLAPLFQKAKTQCTPTATRGIGQTKTNTFMEVACQEGSGYIVVASAPLDPAKDVEVQNCLNYDDTDGNVKCTLSTKEKRMAVLDRYVADAKSPCVIKDRRFVGSTKDGANFFEASCQDGKGYIYKIGAEDKVSESWDCARAQTILGGCTLTDSRQAATEQAGLYTRLAKSAGSTCDVDKYAIFPTSGNTEVVELVCKDGKGGVGLFPATGAGKVLDCGHALVAGYRCGLNKAGSGNDELTADLRKFDQKTCVVSNSRLAAKTTKGTLLLEVACADGFKGYMIEYDPTTYTAVGSTGCAFSGGCKLPGNT